MSSSAISQTGYPKQIVYNGDTVAVLSRHQWQMLNEAHITWQECEETNDSLLVIIDSCQQSFILHNQLMKDKDSIITLKNTQIQDRDNLIAVQKKQIRKLKLHKGILGTIAVVEATVILWLLVK